MPAQSVDRWTSLRFECSSWDVIRLSKELYSLIDERRAYPL